MADSTGSMARGGRANRRHAMVLAAAMAQLSSACGARSGLSDELAFGGANNGGSGTSQGGTANGQGASAQAGAGGLATAAGGAAGMRACGLVIDDMEDGTGRICAGDGRVGAWYEYNDGFGTQLPPQAPGSPLLPLEIPAGAGRGGRAMYSSHHYPHPGGAQAPQAWGAGIGVDLAFDGSTYRTYDASDVAGISFWVRSNLFKGYEVRINTTDTTPIRYGGTCPRDYCGKFAQSFLFHSEWVSEFVSFKNLVGLSDIGALMDFHPERLTNIQFFFVRYPTDSNDGEIWVDDLRFTPGPPPPR